MRRAFFLSDRSWRRGDPDRLGVWQVQRLAWKQGVIADIDARIQPAPVALPASPDPEATPICR